MLARQLGVAQGSNHHSYVMFRPHSSLLGSSYRGPLNERTDSSRQIYKLKLMVSPTSTYHAALWPK